ncbi:hypothetical protein L218DRAFT_1036198 [Marasmius fiardii PR-910]|nr:hypothetical protein L218DRAFT_1036198 [Marasmius fiardii PR-910]
MSKFESLAAIRFTIVPPKPAREFQLDLDKGKAVGIAKNLIRPHLHTPAPTLQQVTLTSTDGTKLPPQKILGDTAAIGNKKIIATLASEPINLYPNTDTGPASAFRAALAHSGYKKNDKIKVYVGTLGPNKGKHTGIESDDKSKPFYRVRIDYDDDKGFHINVDCAHKEAFAIRFPRLEVANPVDFNAIATSSQQLFNYFQTNIKNQTGGHTDRAAAERVVAYFGNVRTGVRADEEVESFFL